MSVLTGGPRHFSAAVVLFCLAVTLGSCERSSYEPGALSPGQWEEGEFERYWDLSYAEHEEVSDVASASGLIVATSHPLATRVGLHVLRAGGSAADAVLTQAMAEIVLHGGGATSFAGVMDLLYFENATGTVHWLDAGWNTVAEELEPWTIPPQGTPSGRTALVPGFMAGVEAAHTRFGNLPFGALFEPAIYIAEEGFPLGETLAGMMAGRREVLSRLSETEAVFLDEDGSFLEAGDHFRQPALAGTLHGIAEQGASYMYQGDWAKKFVDVVQREGGKLSLYDLDRYEAVWRTPHEVAYGDHQVYTPDVDLHRLLSLADAAEVGSLPHFSQSAEALDRMVRAYSTHWVGTLPDSVVEEEFPDFQSWWGGSPPDREDARALWEHIRSSDWPVTAGRPPEVQHSASIIAVDADGNIAVLLHTINTVVWGTTGIFIDGVSISDVGGIWGPYWEVLDTEPGDRLGESFPIAVATRDGVPVLASGSVNHTLLVTFQAVTSVIDHGMTAAEAARMPYFFGPAGSMDGESPWTFYQTVGLIGDGFSVTAVDGMREKGFEILEIPAFDYASPSVMSGISWIGATFHPAQGLYRSGVTPDCCGGWALAN
jgi:gamma-glutamyltranspeptidase/glutathione hydrolase